MQKRIVILVVLVVFSLLCSLRIASLRGGKEAGFALFEPLNAIAFIGMFLGWLSAVGYGVYIGITHFMPEAPDAPDNEAIEATKEEKTPSDD